MNININIEGEVAEKIKSAVSERIQEIVNKVIEENIDEILADTVRKQMKSVAIMYIQSPDMRRQMLDKVVPIVESLIKEKV